MYILSFIFVLLLGSGIADEELKMAEEKFEETKAITETAMYNLLENDVRFFFFSLTVHSLCLFLLIFFHHFLFRRSL